MIPPAMKRRFMTSSCLALVLIGQVVPDEPSLELEYSMRTTTYLALVLIASHLVGSNAQARFRGLGDSEGLILGLAVIADWSPYEGAESPSTTPVPYLSYDWENAHVGVDGINYRFFDNGFVEFKGLLEPRWSFGDPEDSPLFTDIERDAAIEMGLQTEIDLGAFYLGSAALVDVSNVHNGFELSGEVGMHRQIGNLDLDISVGLAFRDTRLSEHLYGVRAEEAREDLPAYAPEAALYPYVGMVAFYEVGDSLGILCFARYEHPGSEAMNSPLIVKRRDASIGIAFLKRF